MTRHVTDKLNEFLRREISAVETYDLALRKIGQKELVSSLRQLREDHDQRVTILRDKIRELSGEPTHGSGVWGAFAKVVQTGADLLGKPTALAALEEGENLGLEMYTDAVKDGIDPVIRELVATRLLPAQRKTHDLCRSLKRHVKAA